ncbi:MAG: hypothetical protein AB7T37_00860 [Dehalococcoidia bacterium]
MTTPEAGRQAIAIAVGPPFDDRILDGEAEISAVTVPGIDGTVVWRVIDNEGPHPWQSYVGVWPDGLARVLSANQDAWSDLVAKCGASITDAATAKSYTETFLEVTRAAMVIVRSIASLDDIRWRPGSDAEEAAKSDLLRENPGIRSRAERRGSGFHVELTLVVDQRLQRNTFHVGKRGELTGMTFEVIAERLPLPVAR